MDTVAPSTNYSPQPNLTPKQGPRGLLVFTYRLVGLGFLALLSLATSCSVGPKALPGDYPAQKGDPQGWKLVWSDEFSGSKLDPSKWDYQTGTGSQYGLQGWGNNEAQFYRPENVRVQGGTLVIDAKKEDYQDKSYTSGRIRTMTQEDEPLFTSTFGRIEARMRLPKGAGLWPAFWMLPANSPYGNWAASGEIDIMENRGREPKTIMGTLHYGMTWPDNKSSGGETTFSDGSDSGNFHLYSIEWEPGVMRWLIDNKVFWETSEWWSKSIDKDALNPYPAPFDVPFYLVLNLAIGGNFDQGKMPQDSDLPAQMLVDYVRVYEKIGGYDMTVTRPERPRDTEAFAKFNPDPKANLVVDPSLGTAKSQAMTVNEMDLSSRDWYFLALQEFGGSGTSESVEVDGKTYRQVKVGEPGREVHSIQLIQHLPIAQGYTYKVSFQAKASIARAITVKVGGDNDNGWAVYSSQFNPKLTTDLGTYSFSFTMDGVTDPTARLEFNLGKIPGDVIIGDVSIIPEPF